MIFLQLLRQLAHPLFVFTVAYEIEAVNYLSAYTISLLRMRVFGPDESCYWGPLFFTDGFRNERFCITMLFKPVLLLSLEARLRAPVPRG